VLRRIFPVVAAALLIALAALPVAGSVTEALSLRELVAQADRVAVVRAVHEEARWQRGRIVTDVTLRVETPMMGAREGEEIVVRRLGGAIGDVGMRVEGEPAFTIGERSVVFARNVRGVLRPVGMSQGVLPIALEAGRPMVLPGGAGLSLVQRTPSARFVPAPAALAHPRPLDDVLDEIRAAVEAGGR
jgi:hypothetical protein